MTETIKTKYTGIVLIKGRSKDSYRALVCHKHIRKYKTFRLLENARVWQRRTKDQLERACVEGRSFTDQFGPMYDTYCAECLRIKSRGQYENYLKVRRSFGPFESMTIQNITSDVVSRVIEQWIKHDPRRSSLRISYERELEVLKSFFNWYADRYCESYQNPVKRRHFGQAVFRKKPGAKHEGFVKPHELNAWLSQLKKHRNKSYYRMALMFVFSGLRLGELMGLSWSNVNFEQNTICVRMVMCWSTFNQQPYIKEGTKNGLTREIPITPSMKNVLLELKKEANGELVFNKQGRSVKPNAVRRAFNQTFEKLDLPYRGIHILRHSFASYLCQSDSNIRSIQELLGHQSVQQTQLYTKVAPHNKQAVVSILETLLVKSSTKSQTKQSENEEPSIIPLKKGVQEA